MEFLNIMLTEKIYTIEEIKTITYKIFKKYNIKEAYIFGSYARGEATRNSDIDIIIKKDDSFTFFYNFRHCLMH